MIKLASIWTNWFGKKLDLDCELTYTPSHLSMSPGCGEQKIDTTWDELVSDKVH